MIYRIRLADDRLKTTPPDEYIHFWDMMDKSRLKAPKKWTNQKGRFYFTERGWKEIGKSLLAYAKQAGLQPKVESRKNPKASDVVWGDTLQVAILPCKSRTNSMEM